MSGEPWEPSEEDLKRMWNHLPGWLGGCVFVEGDVRILVRAVISASPYPRIAEALEELLSSADHVDNLSALGGHTKRPLYVGKQPRERARAALSALASQPEGGEQWD